MVAFSQFPSASVAKSVVEISDAEFNAFMAAQRAKMLRAALERAISWRESWRSCSYINGDKFGKVARVMMRKEALLWRQRRAEGYGTIAVSKLDLPTLPEM